MNLEKTVQVLCSPGKGLTKSVVSVEWSEHYNIKHHHELHSLFEETWHAKCQSSVILFDALKFRLHKVENTMSNPEFSVKFLLGTTTYKEFIGTHYAVYAEQLVKAGINNFSDPQAYLSNPIGVGGIIETEDKNLVFMRRSCKCAEMPGLVDRPGGHPEPSAVTSEHCSEPGKSSEVLDEIFDSVLKEIQDEINIPSKFLSYPLLLGISYNPETFNRPSLEFYLRCQFKMEKIKECYSEQTHAEREESTELLFIPLSEILDIPKLKDSKVYSELTHAAKCAIYLLQIFLTK